MKTIAFLFISLAYSGLSYADNAAMITGKISPEITASLDGLYRSQNSSHSCTQNEIIEDKGLHLIHHRERVQIEQRLGSLAVVENGNFSLTQPSLSDPGSCKYSLFSLSMTLKVSGNPYDVSVPFYNESDRAYLSIQGVRLVNLGDIAKIEVEKTEGTYPLQYSLLLKDGSLLTHTEDVCIMIDSANATNPASFDID